MQLNALLQELEYWKDNTYFQNVYVLIGNKEYRVTDAYTMADPVVDSENPNLREEENHRIIIEIEK